MHRSDGSGTTFNFAYYLAEVSPTWKSKVGVNTSVQWPVGIGAKGNEGVANNVANTQGSIGYVEYAYALQNKLTLRQDDQQGTASRLADVGDLPGGRRQCRLEVAAGLRRDPRQPAGRQVLADHGADLDPDVQDSRRTSTAAREALKFFAWAYDNGGKMAEELHYVPMPANVVKDIQNMWATDIKDASGKPIFAISN